MLQVLAAATATQLDIIAVLLPSQQTPASKSEPDKDLHAPIIVNVNIVFFLPFATSGVATCLQIIAHSWDQ